MSGGPRRALLRALGIGATAPLLSATAQAQGRGSAPGFTVLGVSDVLFLRAAVDRLIPADDFPGAADAGVVEYIDGQLAGPYGRGDKCYRAGPHQPGDPGQGYQLPFTPREVYRESLDALTAHPLGRGFHDQPPQAQDELLRQLEAGRWGLGRVPSAVFFETLLANTIEGYFADPVYGGNRDMAGWRMVGFPGAYAQFVQWVGRHGVRFNRPPMSIAMGAASGHGAHHGPSAEDPRVPVSARPTPARGH